MSPQHPGTRDQTYLDELISIPKDGGVGTARLAPPSEGGGDVTGCQYFRKVEVEEAEVPL